MDDNRWSKVDEFLTTLLVGADESLQLALAASDAAGLPKISVAPNQGKMLKLLAQMSGARRILEIGTLVSLELDPHHAQVANENVARAGVGPLVEVLVGPAEASLRRLVDDGVEPFDFIFIDANKDGYPAYLELSLLLSRVGTIIVADNVVREGEVANPESQDPMVRGVQTFLAHAAAEPRLDGTAVQTVGVKGYDGFAVFIVGRD